MKDSITQNRIGKKIAQGAVVAALWLLLWQAAAMAVGQELLLVSPLTMLRLLAGCLFLMRAEYGRRFAGASRRYGSGGADEPLFVSVRFFSPGPAGDQIYAGGIFYHSGSGLDQILGIGRLCSLFDGVANGMGEFV